MNKKLESLSWLPYKAQMKLLGNRKKIIDINLSIMEINKKIKFHTLNGDNGLSRELNAFRFREPLNCGIYYKFVSKDDVVLDIGANLGWFSILSQKAKKIISIEPIKECIPIIEKNMLENGLENKSIIINSAIGDKNIILIKRMKEANRSEVVSKKEKDVFEIKSHSINHFAEKFSANLVRMDIEGYEYNVLYKKNLSRINKISLEYHTSIIGKEKTKRFLKFMQDEGFIIRHLIDELPLRLYPFYNTLKNLELLKNFTKIRKNIMPMKAYRYFLIGRSVKHINFERI